MSLRAICPFTACRIVNQAGWARTNHENSPLRLGAKIDVFMDLNYRRWSANWFRGSYKSHTAVPRSYITDLHSTDWTTQHSCWCLSHIVTLVASTTESLKDRSSVCLSRLTIFADVSSEEIKHVRTTLLLHPFNGLFSRTTWVSRYQSGFKSGKR